MLDCLIDAGIDTLKLLPYLLITFVMLFISGLRYRWFVVVLVLIGLTLGTILGLYLLNISFINSLDRKSTRLNSSH